MRSDRLFFRDFTLVVAGRIIFLFGNLSSRRLSLYVLDTTGSAAVFGGILAMRVHGALSSSTLPHQSRRNRPRPGTSCGDWTSFTTALVWGWPVLCQPGRGSGRRGADGAPGFAAIQALYQPTLGAGQHTRPGDPEERLPPPAAWWPRYEPWPICCVHPGRCALRLVGLLPMVAVERGLLLLLAVMELFLRIPFQQ